MTTAKRHTPVDFSALTGFDMSSLAVETESNATRILEIPVDQIYELPQVRTESNAGFSEESINGLAEQLKSAGGILQPITVGERTPKGYPVYWGARRLRATRRAGFTTIAAIVRKAPARAVDQMIENVQRAQLDPMEIALGISKSEAEGMTRAEIARETGMNAATVTQHAALLEMPGSLLDLYHTARCRDVLALYNLYVAYKADRAAVEDYIASGEDVTRKTVEKLRARIKSGGNGEAPLPTSPLLTTVPDASGGAAPSSSGDTSGGALDGDDEHDPVDDATAKRLAAERLVVRADAGGPDESLDGGASAASSAQKSQRSAQSSRGTQNSPQTPKLDPKQPAEPSHGSGSLTVSQLVYVTYENDIKVLRLDLKATAETKGWISDNPTSDPQEVDLDALRICNIS